MYQRGPNGSNLRLVISQNGRNRFIVVLAIVTTVFARPPRVSEKSYCYTINGDEWVDFWNRYQSMWDKWIHF